MQEEKNKTTPPQRTGGKRRRRRKKNVTQQPQAAVQQKAASEPVENAPAAQTAETTPAQDSAQKPEETAAVQFDAVQQTPGAEPSQPSKPETPVETPQPEPETETPAENPAQAPEQPQKEDDEAAPLTAETPEVPDKVEAPEKPEAPETAAEEQAPEAVAPEEKAEPEQLPQAEPKPEETSDTEAAEPEQTEEPAAEAEPAAEPEPAKDDEKTEKPSEESETEQTPADAEPQEEEEPEEEESPEEEKRISDMTRTVQLSIEQIMSQVNEEATPDAENTDESTDAEEETDETEDSLQDQVRSGLSGMAKWMLLVVFFVLVIACCGVAWLYRSATPDMLPQITVQFAGETLEPTAYKWKVPVIGNVFKRTYADTLSSTPATLETAVEQVSPDFVISPSDYRTELTVTDANGNAVFEGDVDTFSAFQFTANGTYTAKLVVYEDASSVPGDTSVTGSETWMVTFQLGVRPAIYLSNSTVAQGSVVAVRVSDTLDGTAPTLQTELANAGFFKANSGWICYLPIAWNQTPGTQNITVSAGGYTETLDLKIQATSWEYKDYYRESQRVSPYIGQNDIPAELQKLLTESDETIGWSNGGFVQPFLNTLDIELPFGTTEYVGRSYSERSTNNGTGGRTVTNMVLNTTAGELLIAPASGTVLLAKDLGGDFGYTLVIDHGAGVKSIFYNLQKLSVKAGQAIKQGQTLATCNKTTVAEMRIGTVPIDPLKVWRGQCDALKYY